MAEPRHISISDAARLLGKNRETNRVKRIGAAFSGCRTWMRLRGRNQGMARPK